MIKNSNQKNFEAKHLSLFSRCNVLIKICYFVFYETNFGVSEIANQLFDNYWGKHFWLIYELIFQNPSGEI